MPSAEHETPIALAQLDPRVVGWLITEVGERAMPAYESVRSAPTEARAVRPTTLHADAVLVFNDNRDRPVQTVVLEVQRRWDPDKLRTWRMYLAQASLDRDVPVVLLVYCPNAGVAEKYRREIAADTSSLQLRPVLLSADQVPLITDPRSARTLPAAVVFGALAHGADPDLDAVFPALAAVLRSAASDVRRTYHDIVLAGLPTGARSRWRDYMTTAKLPYLSDEFNQMHLDGFVKGEAEGRAQGEAEGRAQGEAEGRAQGEAEGRAQGETTGRAQDVLVVLDTRRLEVPQNVRDRILGTTDPALLATWLRRAVVAATLDEVLAEQQ